LRAEGWAKHDCNFDQDIFEIREEERRAAKYLGENYYHKPSITLQGLASLWSMAIAKEPDINIDNVVGRDTDLVTNRTTKVSSDLIETKVVEPIFGRQDNRE